MALLGVGLYVKGSREAAALYQEAFGAELGYHVLNEDGTFFHSELNVKGEPFCSVVEAKEPAAGYNPVELGYTFDTREALERAFECAVPAEVYEALEAQMGALDGE